MERLIIFISLSTCLICSCDSNSNSKSIANSSLIRANLHATEGNRGRKTGHYFLYPHHAWYALSWIYWIKVKIIVAAFFVGTAFIWAIQYIEKFYNYCPSTNHIHYGF